MDAEVPGPDTANRELRTVIGKNANRLRTKAGLTLDQVSIAARMRGLNWSEARVADFEAGRVAPNLATLIAFCLALTDAGCVEATFPELLRSEAPIQINDSLLVSDKQVVTLLNRRSMSPEQVTDLLTMSSEQLTDLFSAGFEAFKDSGIMTAATATSGATEERTRKALGIDATDLANLSARLWKRTFSQERDRRAGEGANAQKRGQVSRQMRKELQAAIEAATHGDDK